MWGVFWVSLCEDRSQWRTDFPEWCFRCCWEEGRADRQSSLSLINKPQRWSGEMPSFDKQEGHCLRISTQACQVAWCEEGHRYCGPDGGRAVELGPKIGSAIKKSKVRSVMDRAYGNCVKIFIPCKVFCLPGFPLKVVSCRSGSTQRRLPFIRSELNNCKGVSTIIGR